MIETRQQQRKSKAVASRLSIQQLSRFETGYCPTRKEVGRLEIAHHGSTTQQNPRRNCVVLGIVECSVTPLKSIFIAWPSSPADTTSNGEEQGKYFLLWTVDVGTICPVSVQYRTGVEELYRGPQLQLTTSTSVSLPKLGSPTITQHERTPMRPHFGPPKPLHLGIWPRTLLVILCDS
ncbi:hypothetical protein K432DRAFT_402650 [Lepidopterella palustris CBS 459.81]|uniref:Uncharacterized protein n=1 Tax=Lepidopterella palustris CBS 459.81 TaxID=1314670 RepID=A0A8E2EFQ5_9PEZI|nr:hypothetical protein K432DRAFT_402650 [Lepidopterella palustris CBS 459.81]